MSRKDQGWVKVNLLSRKQGQVLHSLSRSLGLGLLSHYFFIRSIQVRVLCIANQKKRNLLEGSQEEIIGGLESQVLKPKCQPWSLSRRCSLQSLPTEDQTLLFTLLPGSRPDQIKSQTPGCHQQQTKQNQAEPSDQVLVSGSECLDWSKKQMLHLP